MRLTTTIDAKAALQLSREAKWPHNLGDWETMLSLGTAIGFEDSLERLVAVGLRFEHAPASATIGMVIVDAAQRGQGLGRKLMQALIAANDATQSTWLYATQAGYPLYASLGFVETGAAHSFRGKPSLEVETDLQIREAAESDWRAIESLDASVFGAGRIQLLRRIMRLNGELLVALDNERLVGYAFRRDAGLGWQVGPVVAPNEVSALALIESITRSVGETGRIDVPESATTLRERLRDGGMTELPREPLMVLGEPVPGERDQLFAVASSAYG